MTQSIQRHFDLPTLQSKAFYPKAYSKIDHRAVFKRDQFYLNYHGIRPSFSKFTSMSGNGQFVVMQYSTCGPAAYGLPLKKGQTFIDVESWKR